jgi:hypothetical protein
MAQALPGGFALPLQLLADAVGEEEVLEGELMRVVGRGVR